MKAARWWVVILIVALVQITQAGWVVTKSENEGSSYEYELDEDQGATAEAYAYVNASIYGSYANAYVTATAEASLEDTYEVDDDVQAVAQASPSVTFNFTWEGGGTPTQLWIGLEITDTEAIAESGKADIDPNISYGLSFEHSNNAYSYWDFDVLEAPNIANSWGYGSYNRALEDGTEEAGTNYSNQDNYLHNAYILSWPDSNYDKWEYKAHIDMVQDQDIEDNAIYITQDTSFTFSSVCYARAMFEGTDGNNEADVDSVSSSSHFFAVFLVWGAP
jgi:hypothetical protein